MAKIRGANRWVEKATASSDHTRTLALFRNGHKGILFVAPLPEETRARPDQEEQCERGQQRDARTDDPPSR